MADPILPKAFDDLASAVTQKVTSDSAFQPEREAQVGILHFVNAGSLGFTGTLKQRYTDFLVNEIAPDGTVVHLTDDKVPKLKDATKQDPVATDTLKLEQLPLPAPTAPNNAFVVAPSDGDALHPATADFPVPDAHLPAEDFKATPSAKDEGPDKPAFVIVSEDHELLVKYFGATLKAEIVELHRRILASPTAKPATFGSLTSEPITDRPLRGRLHQDVRRIFESRIETESIEDGKIQLSAAPPIKPHPEGYVRKPNPRQQNSRGPNQPKGKLGWQELGGEHLHFSLYKENKDTMEVIHYLCKMLKVKPKDFAFAGTKDRRAVTVQRVSVFRQHAKALEGLNRSLRQARIGNFTYEKHRLELGELNGNQFTITLRDCQFGVDDLYDADKLKLANEVVGQAIQNLQADGFINYFGLQRFGTFGIGTDEIGKKILKCDYEGAVWAILHVSRESLEASKRPDGYTTHQDRIGRDDLARASAIEDFKATGKSHHALDKLPRKFSGESAIIRHLGSRPKDFAGALNMISRNLRTMYVHAYQSLVWNVVASERWARYGNKVIEGDLVFVDTPAEMAAEGRDEVDENGEVVIHAAADDSAVTHDDLYQRARPLTAEEAEGEKYTIFDIVLPTPGFDIEYPGNDIGDYYKEFMGSERGGGLDPADMRRKIKDFSLSGSYRKFIGLVGKDLTFEIKSYKEETEQLAETDLEKLQKTRGEDPNARGDDRHNNSGPQNTRGGRGGRGGRQNDFYNRGGRGGRGNEHNDSRYTETRQENVKPAPPSFKDHSKPQNTDVAARMAQWQTLPTKLAEEDKAAAAEWEARPLRSPDEIYQPVYKDTFIQTDAENEGRRTGFVTTDFIDTEGNVTKEMEVESALVISDVKEETKVSNVVSNTSATKKQPEEPKAEAFTSVPDAMEVDTKAPLALAAADVNMAESFTSAADSQDGGVPLATAPPARTATPPNVPAVTKDTTDGEVKVILHEIPINPPVKEVAITPFEEPEQPTKIAVIIKFDLKSSQYATMALRELMKAGGVQTFKPDYSMGR